MRDILKKGFSKTDSLQAFFKILTQPGETTFLQKGLCDVRNV